MQTGLTVSTEAAHARHKIWCAQTLLHLSIKKYCLNSIKWNDIEVDMQKVRGIKHNSEESLTLPATSPKLWKYPLMALCVKYNELMTAEFLEYIWCERWQHSRCVKISPEKLHDLPINVAFLLPVCDQINKCP